MRIKYIKRNDGTRSNLIPLNSRIYHFLVLNKSISLFSSKRRDKQTISDRTMIALTDLLKEQVCVSYIRVNHQYSGLFLFTK
jgi:hypothetical protein